MTQYFMAALNNCKRVHWNLHVPSIWLQKTAHLQAPVQQGESVVLVQRLKRKLEWHVDQLAWERRKVAALERALQLSDQHLLQLHQRVRNFSNHQESPSHF